MPASILSDRGRNFMSKLVSALCDIFQVTKLRTSSFHPQTNGICERQNSTLAQCMRAYCHENQENWTDYLPSIMMAFRMTPGVQTTGFSPFEILFGRKMKLPIDVSLVPQQNILKAPKEHIQDILKKSHTKNRTRKFANSTRWNEGKAWSKSIWHRVQKRTWSKSIWHRVQKRTVCPSETWSYCSR